MAQGLFRGGIGAGDDILRVDDDEASRHVARDFFTEPFGKVGAVALLAVKPFELFFLFLQFLDDCLHGCGHERGGVVGARRGVQIFRFALGGVLKDFA